MNKIQIFKGVKKGGLKMIDPTEIYKILIKLRFEQEGIEVELKEVEEETA